MTSKEALEIVYRKSCLPTKEPPMECRYCKLGQESKCEIYTAYMRVRKDLDLLEILKKHIYFSSKSGCIRMKDIYKSINNFDYEELKEWLEHNMEIVYENE